MNQKLKVGELNNQETLPDLRIVWDFLDGTYRTYMLHGKKNNWVERHLSWKVYIYKKSKIKNKITR